MLRLERATLVKEGAGWLAQVDTRTGPAGLSHHAGPPSLSRGCRTGSVSRLTVPVIFLNGK